MNKNQVSHFCWNELVTTNAEAAKQFYAAVLGWESYDVDVAGNTYTMFKKGDQELAGMWEIPSAQREEIPPHWMGYISVPNIEEALKKAIEAQGIVKMPVTEVNNFGKFIVIQDPTGAHIAFW